METNKIYKLPELREHLAKLLADKIKKVDSANGKVKQLQETFCEEDAIAWLGDMRDVYDLMMEDGTIIEANVEMYLNDKVKEILNSLFTWNKTPEISDYIKKAKFGDKFKLRNGDNIAVFVCKKEFKKKKIKTQYKFVIEGDDYIVVYNEYGKLLGYEKETTALDIIGPYKEEIDVDKVEEEANKQFDFIERLQSSTHNFFDRSSFIFGYKMGYNNAKNGLY